MVSHPLIVAYLGAFEVTLSRRTSLKCASVREPYHWCLSMQLVENSTTE